MISVCIPVKDPEPALPRVLKRIREIKQRNPGLISEVLVEREGSLREARRALAKKAISHLMLNLDADTLIPPQYLSWTRQLFEGHTKLGAVALDYRPRAQGHLAFGTSVMPTQVMFELYDYPGKKEARTCECFYMWRKLFKEGWILATLPLHAEHKK